MPREQSPERGKKVTVQNAREKAQLADLHAKEIPVLPSQSWALHYTESGAKRNEKLQGLLDGRFTPDEVVADLRPQALLYDERDLESLGKDGVNARIREITTQLQHYDYARFARFVSAMKGRGIPLAHVQTMYDAVSKNRTRSRLKRSLGPTRRQQMDAALQAEGRRILQSLPSLPGLSKVLQTLELSSMGFETEALSHLSSEERTLFESLKDDYLKYISTGDEVAYEELVKRIQHDAPELPEDPPESKEMEELREELEPFKDQSQGPGTESDLTIPPDDRDEIGTPMPRQPGESGEKKKADVFFEVRAQGTSKAPMKGDYCEGRKSYYDIDRKEWSKKAKRVPYTTTVSGAERQMISGVSDGHLKALPIPNGYALDASSLTNFQGKKPQLFRDQKGCFYIQTDRQSTFSIDFLKEVPPFLGEAPIPEDTAPLSRWQLSAETEFAIRAAKGGLGEKAEHLRRYLTSHHFYPGGGDLQMAEALQAKLLNESTGDTYVQNLDASEYLECRSANTLFIAMARKAGIPARMVIGHKVQGSKDGKAVLTSATGHAWAEVWDGSSWRRFDATPPPKPQDKKKNQDEEKLDGDTEQADDGGIEQEQQDNIPQDVQDKIDQTMQDMEENNPSEMPEASDLEMQQAQSDLEQAKEKAESMQQRQEEMKEQINKAQNFEEVEKAKEAVEKDEELSKDMKEDLNEQVKAKEEAMKKDMEEKIEKITDDGFMDEKKGEELLEQLKKKEGRDLDQLKKKLVEESTLADQYEKIKEDVEPLVEKWAEYFAQHLPKKDNIELDEDALTRQGRLNQRSLNKYRNLALFLVKNPRVMRSSVEPKFIASILLDVSGSMQGKKLTDAVKLLVFYCELFTQISKMFGYIRFSISIFSDVIRQIKAFDQDYDSADRYDFLDGMIATVKYRLMKSVNASGGTNMLDALKKTSEDLSKEKDNGDDFVSAFYFIGDGGDTCGHQDQIRKFLTVTDEQGFGDHMKSAIFSGDESQKAVLANIFGEENTRAAEEPEDLIEESMIKFGEDIEGYLEGKTL